MSNFDATAVALANRFLPAQVTPPATYDNIRISTANLPGQMTPLPTVLVFLDNGAWEHFPGKRDGVHNWTVRFYYNQVGDITRDMVALRKWLDVLSMQLQTSAQLGGIVSVAEITDWRVGILEYAGQSYTGIELGVTIVTNEAWAAVA